MIHVSLIVASVCMKSTLAFAPIAIAPAAHTSKKGFEGLTTTPFTITATPTGQSASSTVTQLHLFKRIFGRNEKEKDTEQEDNDIVNVDIDNTQGQEDENDDSKVEPLPTAEIKTITETVSKSNMQTINEEQQETPTEEVQQKQKEEKPMFFARVTNAISPPSASTSSSSSSPSPSNEAVDQDTISESLSVPAPVPLSAKATLPTIELTPTEKATALKAQAMRARLEAEKMDIMLTINKIDKLETELTKLKKRQALASISISEQDGSTDGDGDGKGATNQQKILKKQQEEEQDMRQQLKALKKKLDGGGKDDNDASSKDKVGSSSSPSATSKVEKKDLDTVLSSVVTKTKATIAGQTLSQDEIDARVEKFNVAPVFMKELVAKAAGMDVSLLSSKDDAHSFNTTELILKLYTDEKEAQANGYAYAYSDGTMDVNGVANAQVPKFTQDQIDEVLEAVRIVPQFVKNLYGDDMKNNDTAIALMMLEEEWQSGKLVVIPEITQRMIDEKLGEIRWVPEFLRGDNDTELALELIKADFRRSGGKPMEASKKNSNDDNDSSVSSNTMEEKGSTDSSQQRGGGLFGAFGEQQQKSEQDQMVESLFPASTRKEGHEIIEAEAIYFMSSVLAKDKVWAANGPPEKVPGGFLIRGSTKIETGAELIEAIDTNLAKENRLKNKVNCFYVFDPTPVTGEQMSEGERPPVLFLTSSNVVRDSAPIQRSLVSAVAFGTIWYNSLLPFLLNEKYMKLADEQLALADASMASSVDFLNDLSFPLFVASVGIQAVHEFAHIIVANNNGLNITTPTLIPSLGTGLTGGITSLQNPPKDKQALFDFAIAGPLAGMGASIAMLVYGMTATASMDAATYASLPELPLTMLRQSSLVGGIINSITPGLLTLPDTALGTKALQEINIPLHPFAIAGYFGMMVNAANLLPVGRTDGGRMALTLFGRSGTQLVSFLTFVAMFIQGLMGSDLLLFFFSFVVFFQSELEIPQRNEVDDMDFSRVLLATATGVLVLLTLIPM